MAETPQAMNIYQKLIEVRKTVTYLQKAAQGQQYKYVSSSQVLSAVREKMDELGLLLIPSVTGHKVTGDTVEYMDGNKPKRTTTYFTEIDMTFEWVNAENPQERFSVSFYAQGVDIAGEKGVGKALTYGEKYFILKQFNIATDKDDPDAFQERGQSGGNGNNNRNQGNGNSSGQAPANQNKPQGGNQGRNNSAPNPATEKQAGKCTALFKSLTELGCTKEYLMQKLRGTPEIGQFDKFANMTSKQASNAITHLTVWENTVKGGGTI